LVLLPVGVAEEEEVGMAHEEGGERRTKRKWRRRRDGMGRFGGRKVLGIRTERWEAGRGINTTGDEQPGRGWLGLG
jgi:hypothetical protein